MRAVVGVTDDRWADFLRARPYLTEANFWLPSGGGFRALATGEPFLFKTHHPHNQLVGGGFFSGYTGLTVAEAWEIYGEGNGVASMSDLATVVAAYRREEPNPRAVIGCVLLRNLFFTPPDSTVSPPPDFAKNIVRYKAYELGSGSGIEARIREMLDASAIRFTDDDRVSEVSGDTRGLPILTTPRLGQQAFKSLVLTSYHRRCAITGNRVEPVLQAAHIRPVSEHGQHRVDNGLLLRSDVHILFDRGYLGVDQKYQLQVSPRLREDFGNGDEFYSRAGVTIGLPDRRADRPDTQAVAWHMDTRFLR